MKRITFLLAITGLAVSLAAPRQAEAGSGYRNHQGGHIGIHIGGGPLHSPFYDSHHGYQKRRFRHHRRHHRHHRHHYHYRHNGYGHGSFYRDAPKRVVIIREPVRAAPALPPVSDRRALRAYQTTVVINGRKERAYVTACRNADGIAAEAALRRDWPQSSSASWYSSDGSSVGTA